MIGKPKYKAGDIVTFTLRGSEFTGVVYIVDAFGTWEDSSDVSYDIMVENDSKYGSCLYKHINESLIIG